MVKAGAIRSGPDFFASALGDIAIACVGAVGPCREFIL